MNFNNNAKIKQMHYKINADTKQTNRNDNVEIKKIPERIKSFVPSEK